MDVHVAYAITVALRLRGVDVLTAQADHTDRYEDDALLDRATELGRVLFSQDEDLLREGAQRQREKRRFSGVIYAHQMDATIGQCVEDLELIALGTDSEDWISRVAYLPLK